MTREEAPAPPATESIAADDRRALLDAATELFADQGYSRTTAAQICGRAGVAPELFDAAFDGTADCYLVLLESAAARIRDRVSTAALRYADRHFTERGAVVVAAFVGALAENPRLARVAFGEPAEVSPAVRRQRRVHRRWAAAFLDTQWPPEPEAGERAARRRFAVAMATIGGMFELVADWTRHREESGADAQALVDDLTEFVGVVYTGRVHRR
ncbi:TetR/AcrR family transcriptional regulator [Nocardia farcinica]|uniref:TetR/AcrR family transcriptional regulator n=1 Tax=Nocardia farcinica TaxID=37329 RepID=UPI0037A5DFE7